MGSDVIITTIIIRIRLIVIVLRIVVVIMIAVLKAVITITIVLIISSRNNKINYFPYFSSAPPSPPKKNFYFVSVGINALSCFQRIWEAVSNIWCYIRKCFLPEIKFPQRLNLVSKKSQAPVIKILKVVELMYCLKRSLMRNQLTFLNSFGPIWASLFKFTEVYKFVLQCLQFLSQTFIVRMQYVLSQDTKTNMYSQSEVELLCYIGVYKKAETKNYFFYAKSLVLTFKAIFCLGRSLSNAQPRYLICFVPYLELRLLSFLSFIFRYIHHYFVPYRDLL